MTVAAPAPLRVSVVIPVFNEGATVAEVVRRVLAGGRAEEVVVVDDGSTDGTWEAVRRLSARDSSVRGIRFTRNFGHQAAILAGLSAARGDAVVVMDADGQHQPEDVPKLMEEAFNYHMVVGARAKGSKLRFHRNVANLLYNLFASYVTRFKVQDLTSGFRVLSRREALRFIDLLPNTFSYPTTLTLAFLRSGLTVKYVSIHTLYRAGQSKISLVTDGIRFFLIITKIATLFSPFRVFLPVSVFFFLAGMSNYLYTYLTQGRFTNMSVFMLTTAVIVFMLGLVSEQIALLRMERHGTPAEGEIRRDD